MIKRLLIWYLLLTKRLLKKPSFWAVLLLAPLMTAAMALAAKEDSHVLKVAVYAEESSDPLGAQILSDLQALDGVIQYKPCDSEEELRDMVACSEADAGYVIPADLTALLKDYAAGRKSSLPYDGHLVAFIAAEDTIQLQLAREQFYGVMYPYLSELIAQQFTLDQEEFSDLDETYVRDSIERLYQKLHVEESIFNFAYSSDDSGSVLDEMSYLTAPLRGMLSLFVFLTGLASGLYLLKDKRSGTFDWVRYGYSSVYDWLCILSGTILGGLAALSALLFSGTFTDWQTELPLMLMLVMAVTGFTCILCRIVKDLTAFATCIPVLLLLSAVLCPVFVNFRGPLVIKYLMPPYFYLNGLHSMNFRLYQLGYVLIANGVYFIAGMGKDLLPGPRKQRMA